MSEHPTIRWDRATGIFEVIDQRLLPHRVVYEPINDIGSATVAIRDMHVRGAPLIGVVGAFGTYFAVDLVARGRRDRDWLERAVRELREARPTAVNLNWAVDRVMDASGGSTMDTAAAAAALDCAGAIVAEELERSRNIGEAGLPLIENISGAKGGKTVNILTHCNAGRLACVDYGTATAPIYLAAELGIPVHVWVDETRPRNQGARLTAWELQERNVPFTVVTDNAGGHLMQTGQVDLVLVGTDRTTRNGDVVNKIGTYLKALAARDNNVPFFVAAPSSSIDWALADGSEVPIESRGEEEVHYVAGDAEGETVTVRITPRNAPAGNYAFDVTPARLVTGLVTERGVCGPSELAALFPEISGGHHG
jgi:methylthioribose-1-phosphate isomerase